MFRLSDYYTYSIENSNFQNSSLLPSNLQNKNVQFYDNYTDQVIKTVIKLRSPLLSVKYLFILLYFVADKS